MDYEFHKIKGQIAVLEDVVKEYPTSSVPNVIAQLKARLAHHESLINDN